MFFLMKVSFNVSLDLPSEFKNATEVASMHLKILTEIDFIKIARDAPLNISLTDFS